MKKIIYIIIILILIFIILSFFKSKNEIFNDIVIFNLWSNIGDKNEYVINPKKEKSLKIEVYKTIQKGEETYEKIDNKVNVYKKIAPGSYGKFTIKIKKSQELNYRILLKDMTLKPENLIFILDGQEYNSIKDMQEKLNNIFKSQDKAIINWKWEYNGNTQNDTKDTKDGENAQSYSFEVKAIVE